MSSKHRFLTRFLEFFLIGVVFGLGEDLLAIHFATDSEINLKTTLITLSFVLPFAILTELVVDHPKFWKTIFKNHNEKN